jgi:hypothetical protein
MRGPTDDFTPIEYYFLLCARVDPDALIYRPQESADDSLARRLHERVDLLKRMAAKGLLRRIPR